ncbi:DsrE family protein [Lacisediminimonas sp.]|uniref:DsrE family protein n=1 Tax=Lacisediminimonas sp. TaxID=3060582 RepID=UPI00271F24A0|nr:DsrE family protein [Lacisediminimonas sp.]MDO8299396.1 DsrE family protein [Lacisediminimonas sp.]
MYAIRFRIYFIAAFVLAGLASATPRSALAEPVKVVYHLQDGIEQASRGLGNIRNHLRAEPDTRIVVVALGSGIEFLLQGTTDRRGRPFDEQLAALGRQGVEFRVCNFTLAAHSVPPERLLPQAKLVPSGVAEIARLQAREGFVYLRP